MEVTRHSPCGATGTFPVREGRLSLRTWRQIILCDVDDRPRQREVTVTVMGESAAPARR